MANENTSSGKAKSKLGVKSYFVKMITVKATQACLSVSVLRSTSYSASSLELASLDFLKPGYLVKVTSFH